MIITIAAMFYQSFLQSSHFHHIWKIIRIFISDLQIHVMQTYKLHQISVMRPIYLFQDKDNTNMSQDHNIKQDIQSFLRSTHAIQMQMISEKLLRTECTQVSLT